MRITRDENGCRRKEKEREGRCKTGLLFRAQMITAQHSPSAHMKDARNSPVTMLNNVKPNVNSLKHLEQSVVSREMNPRKYIVVVVAPSLFEMLNPCSSTINLTT